MGEGSYEPVSVSQDACTGSLSPNQHCYWRGKFTAGSDGTKAEAILQLTYPGNVVKLQQTVNGALRVVVDTSVDHSFPSVKRVKVENASAKVITDLTISKTDSQNAFTVYDGKNGTTPVGPWCTSTTCTARCGTTLAAKGNTGDTCYIYLHAKDNVGISSSATLGTLTVSSQAVDETVNLNLKNQAVLYVGGSFIDSTSGFRYLAKYDGNTWHNLGTGPIPFSAAIRSLAVDSQGRVYAGGWFTNGSNQYVAEYDGNTWHNLGTGPIPFNGAIASLVFDHQGKLYAGGWFTDGSNQYVAEYDGHIWRKLGTGPTVSPFNAQIESLVIGNQGRLYVGGNFTDGNGKQYVAEYNAGTWTNLNSGASVPSFNNDVISMVVDSQGKLYVGGDFTDGSGNQYAAEYTGGTWKDLGGAFNAPIDSLAVDSQGKLYAGGNFFDGNGRYVAECNGETWTNLNSGPSAPSFNQIIRALTVDSQDKLYVGGKFTDGSGNQYVAEYANNSWQNVGSGPILSPFNDNIYALKISHLLSVTL